MIHKMTWSIVFISLSMFVSAQKNLNNYKYILIPKKFEFSTSDNQYQLNALTKFLFNKNGYQAYFLDDDLPEDFKNDRCLAATAEVFNDKSGMFKTKLEIVLKDCNGATIMTSDIGQSKLKQFQNAHHEALRAAFKSFENFAYQYVSNNESVQVHQDGSNQVETVVKVETGEIEKKETVSNDIIDGAAQVKDITDLYYAQSIENGFQLVNSVPKVVMILLSTSAENVFIVKDRNAIVFQKEGHWFYAENKENFVEERQLNIKF